MTATEQASAWCHWLASRGVTLSQDEMREMFEKPLMENEIRIMKLEAIALEFKTHVTLCNASRPSIRLRQLKAIAAAMPQKGNP